MNATAALRPLLLSVAVPALAAVAIGQTCAVRNTYRIANSHSGAGSELNVDTGWQTAAPLSTPGSNSNPSATCTSSGSAWAISDYGALHLSGSGSATNCASSGVFLVLDQGPQARFLDTVTVVSPTLPNGAPVQLQFVLTLDGHCTMADPSPSVSFAADVAASSLYLVLTNATGSATATLSTTVGALLQVQSGITVAMYAQGLLGLGMPPITSTYDVDLSARVGISCLTPGVSLNTCSGRTYDPLLARVANVGGGCGPGGPVLAATLPTLGTTQTYSLTNAPASAPVFFAISPGPAVPAAIGPCTVTENLGTVSLLLVGASDASGAFGFGLAIPPSAAFAGAKFTTQELVLDANGPMLGFAQLSNGLEITLGL